VNNHLYICLLTHTAERWINRVRQSRCSSSLEMVLYSTCCSLSWKR